MLIHLNNKIGGIDFADYLKELNKILDCCLEMGSPYYSGENRADKRILKEIANKKKYTYWILKKGEPYREKKIKRPASSTRK